MGNEGWEVAQALADKGIAAFVLKYRLGSKGYRHPAMLSDAARAVRVVRNGAVTWKIDPNRVGIMGSSAGGHLACASDDAFDHLLVRFAADEVHVAERRAKSRQMRMRVDHPWNDGVSLEVHQPRLVVAICHRAGRVADVHHATARDGDRGGIRQGIVDRVDAAVEGDQFGGIVTAHVAGEGAQREKARGAAEWESNHGPDVSRWQCPTRGASSRGLGLLLCA